MFKPLFALNSRLQIEHVISDCIESDDDALALAFRSLRFLSASQILFALNCAAPLLMRQRHFVRSCAACYQDSVRILESLSVFVAFLLANLRALSFLKFSIENFLWQFLSHGQSILAVQALIEYVPFASLTSSGPLYLHGVLSCHLIFKNFLRQLKWKWLSLLA